MTHDFSDSAMICSICGTSVREIAITRGLGYPEPICEKLKCYECNKQINPFDPNRIVHNEAVTLPPSSPCFYREEKYTFCSDECYVTWKQNKDKADDPVIV
jgi:hypothetical protein